MVMSTSKRSYSNFLSLSGGEKNIITPNNNINNIPRIATNNNTNTNTNTIPSSSTATSTSSNFKFLKRSDVSNEPATFHRSTSVSFAPSPPISSSTSTSSLFLFNKLNDSTLNPIDSDFSDLDNDNNNNNYHFNSNKRRINANRPNSFSYPHRSSDEDDDDDDDDFENIRTINSIMNGNNIINDDLSHHLDSSSNDINTSINLTPKEDLVARERCFDYIVQAIDEVWARYCDTTCSAEVNMYDDWNILKKRKVSNVSSPLTDNDINIKPTRMCSNNKSLQYSDVEQDDEQIFDHKPNNLMEQTTNENDEDGYKTEATEYETDSSSEYRTVSKLPDSIKLESLKCRLVKAKNDLEPVYDSSELDDSISFWNRWDMIKYSAIEVMEDDDDDEIVESAIDELEEGRFFNE